MSQTAHAARSSGLPNTNQYKSHSPARNISETEQWISLVAGGALALYGISKRSSCSLISLLAGASLVYRGWSGHCSVYQALGVDTSETDGFGVRAQHGRRVQMSMHINRDRRELYDAWRDLANLPKWMRHLDSVQVMDADRSRWVARGPMGKQLSWDAEIITDRPGEVIAWQSLPGSQVSTAGSVHFTTPANGEGTELMISLKYDPPGGAVVAGLANLLGQGLEQELREDLRRFKQLFEAGEIATAAQHPYGANPETRISGQL